MPDKLLVADDSLTIQRVIELAFADDNVDVVAVSSGEEAIRLIDARSPAIVLADTRMPDRSGYEIAEFVSSKPTGDQMPVVLRTGLFEPVDDRRARAAGCDTVLVKPFDPSALMKTAHETLGRRRESSGEPEDASGTRGVSVPAPVGEPDLEWPIKDHVSGPSSSGGAGSVEAAPSVATLPPAVADPDPERTREASSSLVITDELVDRLATRVIGRLSDQVVRDVTTRVVTEVAERLVAEEIARLKAKLR